MVVYCIFTNRLQSYTKKLTYARKKSHFFNKLMCARLRISKNCSTFVRSFKLGVEWTLL